ncbi:GNAT family N-acetyltransferase [Pseudocnuella soli]|uniref:GNAT family N-acetyltransferase n=1 Tax=Pseudocnuella soli TaxID=2502779 RepID=UPI00105297B0|nr:GNAT family N-acetyltransferase [Pseudocnuella soli]
MTQNIVRPTEADFDALTQLWEASVRATHHFLQPEDILWLKPKIRNEYLYAVALYCSKNSAGAIEGFLGTSADKIEMLFIHPQARGKGVGKNLLRYAVNELGKTKVDVNEQNEQAVGFYRHMGFTVIDRTETDSLGKPYPILCMERPTSLHI